MVRVHEHIIRLVFDGREGLTLLGGSVSAGCRLSSGVVGAETPPIEEGKEESEAVDAREEGLFGESAPSFAIIIDSMLALSFRSFLSCWSLSDRLVTT